MQTESEICAQLILETLFECDDGATTAEIAEHLHYTKRQVTDTLKSLAEYVIKTDPTASDAKCVWKFVQAPDNFKETYLKRLHSRVQQLIGKKLLTEGSPEEDAELELMRRLISKHTPPPELSPFMKLFSGIFSRRS